MSSADKTIADILGKYGEPMAGSVWRVQGQPVIYHKTLERIAAQAKITWDMPVIVRAEEGDVAILVAGRMGDRMEWSIGEARVGVNYRVSGKQAAYVYAMAEKRAKDRVILKLIELSGEVYSEDEADEFRDARPALPETAAPAQKAEPPAAHDPHTGEFPGEPEPEEGGMEVGLMAKIDEAASIQAVTSLMTLPATQKILDALDPPVRHKVRDHATERLMALGWAPTKKAS